MLIQSQSIATSLKQWMVSLLLMLLPLAGAMATDICQQRLTKEEFKARQRAFITEQAQLTEVEAEAFFPLYFELQERKRQLNDEVWSLLKKGREKEVSEKKYEEILEGVYDTRLAIDRLEKSYYEKFKQVLSFKKIYLVQQAEMRFHREVLKNFGEEKRGDKQHPRQGKERR